jgi:hypothetical protein
MNKILYNTTKLFINILKRRGVNLSKLNIETKEEMLANSLKNKLIDLQNTLSLTRAEIIENQNNLLVDIEPTLISILSKTEDNWHKNVVTELWVNKLNNINQIIDKHETIIIEIESTYSQYEKIIKK